MRARIAAGIVVTTAIAGGSGVLPASAGSVIALKDDSFAPTKLTVSKGATVTLKWRGHHPHNAVGGGVKTAIITHGTRKVRFRKRGSFTLVCQVHPGMKMRLRVK